MSVYQKVRHYLKNYSQEQNIFEKSKIFNQKWRCFDGLLFISIVKNKYI